MALAAVLFALYLYHFLLFHLVAELSSITIAFCVFLFVWNTRQVQETDYLYFLGVAYLFSGMFDLLHALTYEGMTIVPFSGANRATQLWLAARFIECGALCTAPFFHFSKGRATHIWTIFTLTGLFFFASIFIWGIFPDCFAPGKGLTHFKIGAEVFVILLLGGAAVNHWRTRARQEPLIFQLVMGSILLTIASEVSFCQYTSVTDSINMMGHLLKFASFYLIYRAVIQTGLMRPYALLLHNLQERRRELRNRNRFLEIVLDTSGILVLVVDSRGMILRFNRACEVATGYASEEVIGRSAFLLLTPPGESDPLEKVLSDHSAGHPRSRHESHWISRTGERRLITWTSAVVTDEDGRVAQIISTGADITDETRGRIELARELGVKAAEAAVSEVMLDPETPLKRICQVLLERALFLTGGGSGFVQVLDREGREPLDQQFRLQSRDECRVAPDVQAMAFHRDWDSRTLGDAPRPDSAQTIRKDMATGYPDRLLPQGHIPLERVLTVPMFSRGLPVARLTLANSTREYNEIDRRNLERLGLLFALYIEGHRFEEALIQEQKRLASIMETSPAAMMVVDVSGRILYANRRAGDLFGLTPEEITSLRYDNPQWKTTDFNGEPLTEGQWPFQRVMTSGAPVRNVRLILTRSDGGRIVVQVSSSPLKDRAGNITAVISAIDDITDSVRNMEEAMKLAGIVESLGEAVFGLDLDGRLNTWNLTAARLFGYSRSEMETLGVTVLAPDVRPRLFNWILDEVHAGRKPGSLETTLMRKDGLEIDVFLTSSLMRDMSGRVSGLSIVAMDITRRKRDEKALAEYARRLAISNEELASFVHVVSHDLTAPLDTISGFLRLYMKRQGDKLDEKSRDLLDRVVLGADRMARMIDDLARYGRIDVSNDRFEEVDLEGVLSSALQNLASAIEKSDAVVECADLPRVTADRSRILQVFQNILANAIKFQNQRPPHIQVQAREEGGFWVISITDNGPGMDRMMKEEIFLLFRRLHTRNEYPGTGLGLALCKKIVEMHGGRIWADTVLGQGTTISFSLPA